MKQRKSIKVSKADIYLYEDGTLWITMPKDAPITGNMAIRAGHEPKAMRQIKAAFGAR